MRALLAPPAGLTPSLGLSYNLYLLPDLPGYKIRRIKDIPGSKTVLIALAWGMVAVLLPGIDEWARKWRLPLSRLLLPMSYAAILGGTTTLVGTPPNILAAAMLELKRNMNKPAQCIANFSLK